MDADARARAHQRAFAGSQPGTTETAIIDKNNRVVDRNDGQTVPQPTDAGS